MNIRIIAVGKTDRKPLQVLIEEYEKRLRYYVNFQWVVISEPRNTKSLSENQQKDKEGLLILKHIEPFHHVILLDERGKEYDSVSFADFIQKKMNASIKQLVFVIGGAYGFSQEVYKRADGKLSLSKLTFSHQMVRLFVVEQIYRAFTILNNEPYHHQ